jgi:hypothetical protein
VLILLIDWFFIFKKSNKVKIFQRVNYSKPIKFRKLSLVIISIVASYVFMNTDGIFDLALEFHLNSKPEILPLLSST